MNQEMVFRNKTGLEKHQMVQYRSKFFPLYVHLSCFSPYFLGLPWLKAFILKVVEGLTLKLTKELTAKAVYWIKSLLFVSIISKLYTTFIR